MEEKAPESRQIKKARARLKKNLEKEHQKFTSETLQEIGKKIRGSITRHHKEPNYLKKHRFTFFDENAHPAKLKSKQILKLQEMLKY